MLDAEEAAAGTFKTLAAGRGGGSGGGDSERRPLLMDGEDDHELGHAAPRGGGGDRAAGGFAVASSLAAAAASLGQQHPWGTAALGHDVGSELHAAARGHAEVAVTGDLQTAAQSELALVTMRTSV